jgi:hypothetical protein
VSDLHWSGQASADRYIGGCSAVWVISKQSMA